MKKMFLPAIIILIIAAGSCSDSEVGSGENKPCILSKEDSMKLASWNRLFGSEQFAKPKMLFARPVLPRHANECVKQYQIVYEKPDCEAVAAAYTEGVSFFGDELQEWLLGMEGKVDFTHIRIVYGVYTENFVNTHGIAKDNIGKHTVFIWPYRGNEQAKYIVAVNQRAVGDTADVFNLGELHP